jgi:hypothetical protein
MPVAYVIIKLFARPFVGHDIGVSEQFKLVGNGALVKLEYIGQIGYAHFPQRKRYYHFNSGNVGKHIKKRSDIGQHLLIGHKFLQYLFEITIFFHILHPSSNIK